MSKMLRILLAACILALPGCTPRQEWHQRPKAPASPSPAPSLPIARMGEGCPRPGAMARTASGNPLLCVLREGEEYPRWRVA